MIKKIIARIKDWAREKTFDQDKAFVAYTRGRRGSGEHKRYYFGDADLKTRVRTITKCGGGLPLSSTKGMVLGRAEFNPNGSWRAERPVRRRFRMVILFTDKDGRVITRRTSKVIEIEQ